MTVEMDEAAVPGGITWDEAAAFPNLADLECPRCGRIATCDDCWRQPGSVRPGVYPAEVTSTERNPVTTDTPNLRTNLILRAGYADAHDLPAPVDRCGRCHVELRPGDTCPDGGTPGCPLPKEQA